MNSSWCGEIARQAPMTERQYGLHRHTAPVLTDEVSYKQSHQVFGLLCSAPDFGPLLKSCPRTRIIPVASCAWHAHLTQGDDDGDRNREVVQPDQGVWFHSTARRRQG